MDVELYPHTFCTSASADRFQAIMMQACKARFTIDREGYDKLARTHFFTVAFTALEDRDRATIAMRFVDKDLAERATAPQKRAARA